MAVVAIDFGTARSGYAFTFNDPNDIKINEFDYQGISPSLLLPYPVSLTPSSFTSSYWCSFLLSSTRCTLLICSLPLPSPQVSSWCLPMCTLSLSHRYIFHSSDLILLCLIYIPLILTYFPLFLSLSLSFFLFLSLGDSEKTFTALMMSGTPGNLKFYAFGNEANDKLYVPDILQDHEMHGFRYLY